MTDKIKANEVDTSHDAEKKTNKLQKLKHMNKNKNKQANKDGSKGKRKDSKKLKKKKGVPDSKSFEPKSDDEVNHFYSVKTIGHN